MARQHISRATWHCMVIPEEIPNSTLGTRHLPGTCMPSVETGDWGVAEAVAGEHTLMFRARCSAFVWNPDTHRWDPQFSWVGEAPTHD